ncbi:MarR family winged helix-turn-helix transcriptional regulator [Nonomuraea sp. B19D2]
MPSTFSRMEQRGMVRREEFEGDARGAMIVLTEGGLRAIQEAAPAHVESVCRHFIDLLSPEQIQTLGTIAETVLAHLPEAEGGDPAKGS